MTLPAGTRLGPYEILSPLGAGGMGEVYRARDTRLSREVAVKVLPAAVASDPERLSRFETEARAASALNHPAIVTIHDVGQTDGVSWIAMELVEGTTLRELMLPGPLPIKRLLQIAPQITDGLAKAHESGILHRDLKPENVMVTKDGLVKILDFGLAKLKSTVSGSAEGSQLSTMQGTTPGVVVGTVSYMSPEQASAQTLDFRSDQFAFGSMLYEMATGRKAFQKKTAIDTLAAVLNEEPEPIASINPQVPAPLRWIVERCLSKEPRGRHLRAPGSVRNAIPRRRHSSIGQDLNLRRAARSAAEGSAHRPRRSRGCGAQTPAEGRGPVWARTRSLRRWARAGWGAGSPGAAPGSREAPAGRDRPLSKGRVPRPRLSAADETARVSPTTARHSPGATMRPVKNRFALLAAVVCAALAAVAAAPQPGRVEEPYVEKDVVIPMRDGVKLHTKIFEPRGEHGPLPILMQRTPYGIAEAGKRLEGSLKAFADDGYVFVFQDLRGKFGSEGVFVMQRPARTPGDTKALDEGTDTFDTIAWLLGNVPGNNGRVGMLGVSYEGWTTIMGALEPHPALAAISPQASPSDMWLGDDFHHNGAFRLSYGFEYAFELESAKDLKQFGFDRYDTYGWYLALGPLSNVNARFFHGKIPTWNDFFEHPDYDEFWKRQTMIPHIREVQVPTLNVAGWWDQEDFFGPLQIYAALERHDPKDVNRLVVGPWNHGGWEHGDGDRLGAIPFDSATSKYFREEIQAPWFAYYLKDRGPQPLPEALTFEAGANRWRRWEAWPPVARTKVRNLYFGADGSLSFAAPAAGAAKGAETSDAYLSDPAHPVPYRRRPIQTTYFPGGSKWSTWLVEDQRFVDDRPDVLTFQSAPLTEDVTVAGEVVAHLYASTTGSDADWVVRLIDVYPERYPENWDLAGFELMVSNEVFRGRYRASFEKAEPIASNAVLDYTYSLHTQSYAFRKGHRIMVQVQSTWFPIIDRNPQTFVPNIFKAEASGFRAATHRIYRSREHPSHVAIPVLVRPPA